MPFNFGRMQIDGVLNGFIIFGLKGSRIIPASMTGDNSAGWLEFQDKIGKTA